MKLLFAKTILAANIRAATSESAGVIVVADNFANAKDGESWVQLSPFGRFPNQLGMQVFTADDAKNICNEFNGVLSLPQRMMGLPFYIGHPDHPAFKDQYKDTRSYGRVKELECRHDASCATCNTFANSTGEVPCEVHGLFGRTKWNDEGKQLIANETFNGHSVNWRLRKVGGEWHPFSLKSVGFTNEPNIPVKPIFAANEADAIETALLERRFCRMTVMRSVTAANQTTPEAEASKLVANVKAYRKMTKLGKVIIVKEHSRSDERVGTPRKNESGEWEVPVYVNGKRDEAKTYYTDDKDDAFATAKHMTESRSK